MTEEYPSNSVACAGNNSWFLDLIILRNIASIYHKHFSNTGLGHNINNLPSNVFLENCTLTVSQTSFSLSFVNKLHFRSSASL